MTRPLVVCLWLLATGCGPQPPSPCRDYSHWAGSGQCRTDQFEEYLNPPGMQSIVVCRCAQTVKP